MSLTPLEARGVAIAFHDHVTADKLNHLLPHDQVVRDPRQLRGFDLGRDVAEQIKVQTHFNGKETKLRTEHLIELLENPENLAFFEQKINEITMFELPEDVVPKLGKIGRTLTMLHSLVEIKRHQALLALNEKKLAPEHHEIHAKEIHAKHDVVTETIRGFHRKIQNAISAHGQKLVADNDSELIDIGIPVDAAGAHAQNNITRRMQNGGSPLGDSRFDQALRGWRSSRVAGTTH